MPSPKLARLQDEAATLSKTISDLRALDVKDDDPNAADIAERLAAAEKRSAEVEALAKREHELDARLAGLQAVTAPSEPRRSVDGEQGKPASKRAVLGGGTRNRFDSVEAAEGVGIALRDLAHGRIEMRADMGETAPTYNGAGAEYIQGELYNTVINTVSYASVGAQLAFAVPTNSNSITLPKAGEITVDFVDENTETVGQAVPTSKSVVSLYDLRAEVPVSNNLLEDSPVAVANLIVQKGGSGFARKIDGIWLGGHTGKSITGLAAAIGSGATVQIGATADLTASNIGNLIGKVEDVINDTAWVVSSLGWAELMKVYAAQLGSMVVGGGRVVPTIMGSPVFKVKGLPTNTLAIYGDFASASAVAYKPAGLQITALRELGARKNQTIFNMIQRIGILNHDAGFVAKLTRAAGT